MNVMSKVVGKPAHLCVVNIHELAHCGHVLSQVCRPYQVQSLQINLAHVFFRVSCPLIGFLERLSFTAKTNSFSWQTSAFPLISTSTLIAFLTSLVRIMGTFLFRLPVISIMSNLNVEKIHMLQMLLAALWHKSFDYIKLLSCLE